MLALRLPMFHKKTEKGVVPFSVLVPESLTLIFEVFSFGGV